MSKKGPIYFARNSVNNILHGLLNRLNSYHKISAYPDLTVELDLLADLINPTRGAITIEHAEKYLASRKWRLGKKNEWRRKCMPFVQYYEMHHCVDKSTGWDHDVFIKDEFYNDAQKAPRLICNCQPGLKAYLTLLLDDAADKFFHTQLAVKHLTKEEKMELIHSYPGKFCVVTDFSSFESSINWYYKHFECEVYRRWIGNHEAIDLYDSRNVLKLKSRFVDATLFSARMSGDFTTSLGNSIVNFSILHAASRLAGDPDPIINVEGDDGFMLTNADLDLMQSLIVSWGFDLKWETGIQSNFCSNFVDDHHYHGNFMKFLKSMLLVKPSGLPMRDHLSAMCRSAIDNFPTNPVVLELFRRYNSEYVILEEDEYALARNGYKKIKNLQGKMSLFYAGSAPEWKLTPNWLDFELDYNIQKSYISQYFSGPTRILIERCIEALDPQMNEVQAAEKFEYKTTIYNIIDDKETEKQNKQIEKTIKRFEKEYFTEKYATDNTEATNKTQAQIIACCCKKFPNIQKICDSTQC